MNVSKEENEGLLKANISKTDIFIDSIDSTDYSTFSQSQFARNKMGKQSITGLIVTDVVIILFFAVMLIIFRFAITPFQRGFYCDDENIKYPYHDSTISSFVLYFTTTLLNVISMIIIEGYIYYQGNNSSNLSTLICSKKIIPFLWKLYHVIGVFAFTCLVSQTLTDTGKYSIGRLRPHFLDVCKPNITNVDCSSYVTDFECSTPYSDKIRESRLSFPSGHASFSAVTMVYFILYLQARFQWAGTHLLRPFFQVAAYTYAFYTALSRVSDYKHHPTDVLAGHILGSGVAIFMAFFVSDLFKKNTFHSKNNSNYKNEDKNHSEDTKNSDIQI